jgi:tetratricopeptide (TPR) repeat protein
VFISPSSPEVLDFSKYMVGIARNHLRTGLNQNMQFAMYLYEGLRASGISGSDGQTPYVKYRRDPAGLDAIQFPSQTLMYRSGDLDDLGLLFAASLEAAGIRGALIPLANDFIVACSLGINSAAAGNFFNSLDNLIIIDDEVWMPLALSNFQDGFVNSWAAAAAAIRTAYEAEEAFDFIVLADAWQVYPPAVPAAQTAVVNKAPEQNVFRVVEIDMLRYISSELGPKIQNVRDAIASRGGTVTLYNQLGILYVRAGMYNDAKSAFQRSASMGSDTAMANLGNLAMLEKDTAAAERWYTQALERNPTSRAAVNGLNQIAIDRME